MEQPLEAIQSYLPRGEQTQCEPGQTDLRAASVRRQSSEGGGGGAAPLAGIGKTEKNRRLRGGIWGEIREEEEEGYLAGAGTRTVVTRGT